MAYPEYNGKPNQAEKLGKILYVGDGTNFYPLKGIVNQASSTTAQLVMAQREPFIFRPGAAALSGGAVATGTRSGAGTITAGTVANSTYWGTWTTYSPFRSGPIDGKSTGGVVYGQLTVGLKSAAGTCDAKVTARIANTASTASPTTFLTLTAAIGCTTAEIYKTYDIPYLLTDSAFNAVPFSVAIGVQTDSAASASVGRIMESSWIAGEYEPNA